MNQTTRQSPCGIWSHSNTRRRYHIWTSVVGDGERTALPCCGFNVCAGVPGLTQSPSKLFHHLDDWLKLQMSFPFLLVILLLSAENYTE